jgi:hypothetical protein
VASSPYAGTASPYASQDYYPQEYTEYRDPVEHAKEKIKKLDKKIAKKEKRRKQKLEDAKTAAETLIALGVWNAILWLVPLFGNKWYTKMFNGFGHLIVTISLWSINVVVECKMMDWGFGLDKVVMADYDPNYRICTVISHLNGTHSLTDIKNLACALPGPAAQTCDVTATLWWTSYMLIFAFSVSAISSLFGSLFLYYYWYVDHLKMVRYWAMGWYGASPFLGVVCFAFYNVIAPDVGQLPRAWTSGIQVAKGAAQLYGLGEINPIGEDVFWNKFGWCWFFMYITIAFSLATLVVWGMFFIKHSGEDQAELRAAEEEVEIEDKIWQIEDQVDYLKYGIQPDSGPGYGATGYAGGHDYSGYQGYAGY